MKCDNPYVRTPVGLTKMSVILSDEARSDATPFPCGRCYHCRKNKARIWRHRIMLEGMCHEENCFVTLTYNDEHLPAGETLVPEDLNLFLKRLRKKLYPEKIRYFAVGEYGDKSWRPHYHAILFGTIDEDAINEAWTVGGEQIGWVDVGELNEKTAGYITGYVVKGLTSKKDKELIKYCLYPEFSRSSTGKPGGIGIEAIMGIGDRLKGSKWKDGLVISKLQYGNSHKPLGRYLTQKLIEFGGLDKRAYDEQYYDYISEVFDKHLERGIYKDNIVNEEEAIKEKIEFNDANFVRRRIL